MSKKTTASAAAADPNFDPLSEIGGDEPLDGNALAEEYGNEWGDEWGGDNAKVEREFIQLVDGQKYQAHIIGSETRVLDRIEGKAAKRIVDFNLRVYLENEAQEIVPSNMKLRGRWITASYEGQPADVSELIRVGVDALGAEAPRNAAGKPRVDAQYTPKWWCDAVIGRPIRVRAKRRTYTKDGEEHTTFDLLPAGPWPEGEVL